MGFLDKIKDTANKIKEDNKNLGSTMKRINNKDEFFGNVNRGIKNGDFWEGSYVSIENNHGVIYGSSQDDYPFEAQDIKSYKLSGNGPTIQAVNEKKPTLRFIIEFNDGKTAQMDIVDNRIDEFKGVLGL